MAKVTGGFDMEHLTGGSFGGYHPNDETRHGEMHGDNGPMIPQAEVKEPPMPEVSYETQKDLYSDDFGKKGTIRANTGESMSVGRVGNQAGTSGSDIAHRSDVQDFIRQHGSLAQQAEAGRLAQRPISEASASAMRYQADPTGQKGVAVSTGRQPIRDAMSASRDEMPTPQENYAPSKDHE